MAKCYFTGKAKSFGNNRSHALNATRRSWSPNLQRRRMLIDGRMQTISVSAKALRTLVKTSGK
ncbi:MAG TPA: 50S ribosomal protein L28 [Thermoflexales bacterium]|jgi:large subunit ribosomal protein L28|nr:50S ribosomal protein L28 [Thermoflexales bacterium]HQX09671.1 50S ribosomal protein L28 [Thermoflexales bacterium]HQY23538.1 50S ribosomal protein L28 [Thermoflexales bacterium]HQZ54060.1 50S ribosomal protein L28 [Thermoflexales bacterium]HRA53186.1 50S ribosomal protein L28 [Thermoflexales bacterium]